MAELFINAGHRLSKVNKEIQGQFSEHLGRGIYGGIYVGENSDIPNENGMRKDVVQALKAIRVPVLRWPGGCFADEYHWMDGIGPKEKRKKIVNTHWGGVTEDNSFGTHEYYELVRQLGCESYVNGNVGSGSIREMSEWVEYITMNGVSPMADLRRQNGHEEAWTLNFLGVGNENWGCGGNMTPEYYANLYRRYQTYVRQYDPDHPVRKICGGPNVDDYDWTDTVMKTCFSRCPAGQHGFMDGLSLHYYVHPGGWENKGSATDFDENTWYQTMKKTWYMDELIRRHGAIMDRYDPDKEVGLVVDEWGGWYDVEPGTNPGFLYQQNTMRDALVAGITLNIFNKHSDRVKMAAIAQMINVLQSVLLTEGDQMIKTPTYHVFDLYKDHQDATLVESSLTTHTVGTGENLVPDLSESVTIDNQGRLQITLTNLDPDHDIPVDIRILDHATSKVDAEIVTGEMHEKNTFDDPERVTKKAFAGVFKTERGLHLVMPAVSVIHITAE